MDDSIPPSTPHDNLKPIIDDVWFVTGTAQFKPLIRLSRNMVVVRNGNDLTLINAIRLDAEGERALDALGEVAHVMKIGLRGMDDGYYRQRYGAKHWAADPEPGSAELAEDTALPLPDARIFRFRDSNLPKRRSSSSATVACSSPATASSIGSRTRPCPPRPTSSPN